MPSGARTRVFRSPHGVVTGDATGSAPAAMSCSAVASLSPTWSASRTLPATRLPASTSSTSSAWRSSSSSIVPGPASSTTTLPRSVVQHTFGDSWSRTQQLDTRARSLNSVAIAAALVFAEQ